MLHNEDTRVKIPALIHLTRLGYDYFSKEELHFDPETNIAVNIFLDSIKKINPESTTSSIKKKLDEIKSVLKNKDNGKEFLKLLLDSSDIRLINFDDVEENQFSCVTELEYKSGSELFRPDITIFINGLPLSFLEVKIPNNKDGIFAERARINKRFSNPIYNQFCNVTQLLIFSNNMNYDDTGIHPYQGAFYATPSKDKVKFNFFREQEVEIFKSLDEINLEKEKKILIDNNLPELHLSSEFAVNKSELTPTNKIITSLLSKNRILFLLKYGFVYVNEIKNETKVIQKHVVRYQQLFAMKKMGEMIDAKIKKGIIWHTQGSGKTALTFFSLKYITDLLTKKGTVPRFYFIVDRIDLLQQAQREFEDRGLFVNTAATRDELMSTFISSKSIENNFGKSEITVVNIQKFKESNETIEIQNDRDVQRIFFIDESHRGYKQWGTFLTNLLTSDKNAIYFALTGTPLIQKDVTTKEIFGDYIHKYFYNESIADGITLRLMRDPIKKEFQLELQDILEKEVSKGSVTELEVLKSKAYVNPLLKYIVNDFTNSRIMHDDNSMGGMIVAHSTDQAREIFKQAKESYKDLSFALILSDEGSKEDRQNSILDFEEEKVDILIVYRMLLTGFDQHRLKKLYLGRLIKAENLLQAVTRVNRTYNDFSYGYIVDFADIKKEFDKTNQLYLEELKEELGDEIEQYQEMFVSFEEAEDRIKEIKEKLFFFDTANKELFVNQLNDIEDRAELIELKNTLSDAKDLFNMIKISEHKDLLEKLDFFTLNRLLKETELRLQTINYLNSIDENSNAKNLLNIALTNIEFRFSSMGEEELRVSDEYNTTLQRTREAFDICFDKKDKVYVAFEEELKRILKPIMEENNQLTENHINELENLRKKIEKLNAQNNRIFQKYNRDEKFSRIHKRIMENEQNINDQDLFIVLFKNKQFVEEQIFTNADLLKNIPYFKALIDKNIINAIQDRGIHLSNDAVQLISELIIKEFQFTEIEAA